MMMMEDLLFLLFFPYITSRRGSLTAAAGDGGEDFIIEHPLSGNILYDTAHGIFVCKYVELELKRQNYGSTMDSGEGGEAETEDVTYS